VIKFYTSLFEMLKNHMAFLEPVNISDTQVGLNAYCGVATILLALLYLFDGKLRLRERLAHYGLCALLLFSFSFNILNYIWHGFHIQNGLPNRFAFLYIAVLLIMAYDAVGHIRSYWLPQILFAFLVPAGFVVYCIFFPGEEGSIEPWVYYVSLGLLVLYFGIVLLGRYLKKGRGIWTAVLSGVLLVEVAANAIYGIQCDGNVTRSIYIADQVSYQKMMAEQNDDTFFRSEVDRQRMRNVTMYCGGNALVMFNSTMQESVIDFCDSLGIEARTNKNGYLGVTKLMNDILGIKYLASPSKKSDTMYQFTKLTEDGELALYYNENALSLGFMVKDDIKDWDIEAGEPLQVQNSFVELATGLDPIYVLDRYIDMENGQNYGIKIPENKQVYLCLDTRVAKISLSTPEYDKDFKDFTDHLYVINGSSTDNMADFTVDLKDSQKGSTVRAEVYTCANDAYQKVIDKLSESQLTDVQVDGNKVSGSIDAKEDGTLLLTVPYDTGWTITVDGQETEFYSVGKALTGVHVSAGNHTIAMKFTPPGFVLGLVLSLVCVLLYLVTILLENRHPKWFAQGPHMGRVLEKDTDEKAEGAPVRYGFEADEELEDEFLEEDVKMEFDEKVQEKEDNTMQKEKGKQSDKTMKEKKKK